MWKTKNRQNTVFEKCSVCSVYRSRKLLFGLFDFFFFLLVVLVSEDKVHDDTDNHGNSSRSDGDDRAIDMTELQGESADTADEDSGSDEDVLGLRHIDVFVDHHLDTGGSDESV